MCRSNPSPVRVRRPTIVPSPARAQGERAQGARAGRWRVLAERSQWPKHQSAGVRSDRRPRSLFRDCYLQWMAQLQRVEPSVRGGIPTMPWAVLAPAERGRSASGAFRPTKPGGKTAVTIRPGARPPNPNELWRPSLSHPRGTKKPPAGCPAGGGQLKSSHEHQGTMSRWTRMRSP